MTRGDTHSPTRLEFEPWLEAYLRKRYPELERALLNAIQAFDAIQARKAVEGAQLAPLVEAASSDRIPLYENATELLGRLARDNEAARKAVLQMTMDPRAHVRFNAILCVNQASPEVAFCLQVLRTGLRDKSARVREKAADWTVRCGFKALAPDLAEALKSEPNAKARAGMQFALDRLRKA